MRSLSFSKKTRILVVAIFFVGIIFSFAAVPESALAQAKGLIPCGTSYASDPCTLCHLIVGIQGLIDFGLKKIMVPLAILMIVIAGVIYIVSAGNEHMMGLAKTGLTYILVGFAIILAAWVMVNTILNLVGIKSDLGLQITRWDQFSCSTTSSTPPTSSSTTTPGATGTGSVGTGTSSPPGSGSLPTEEDDTPDDATDDVENQS